MEVLDKLEILREAFPDQTELDLLLAKLFDVALATHRLRLQRYENALRQFEQRYGMESPTFYRRFEAGELGDSMDFFEWAGLYELRQDLVEKVQRLEAAS